MQFVPSNSEDISKYYRGTYVKFEEYGDKLFYIQDIFNREIQGSTEDGDSFRLYLSEEHPYVVEYILPKKSYFQFGNCAALLRRVPMKQYRRGICKDNTSISSLLREGVLSPNEVGFNSLRAYVNKQNFVSLNDAVSNKEKYQSHVLSSRMAYCCGTKMIYIDELPVAVVTTTKEEKSIRMVERIYFNEVSQIVKGSIFDGNLI